MKRGTGLVWRCADRAIETGRMPLVMGILNVTPDSFSDGGRHFDRDRAVARALEMVSEGADIIDVGGESTRPGALPVDVGEETDRVAPVIKEVRARSDVPISIDTRKAAVAEEAILAGAQIINDVSAMTHDRDMPKIARKHGAGVILMHMLGEPRTMQNDPQYDDVVAEVSGYLGERIREAVALGIDPERLAVDPGIGFGKTVQHNIRLLGGLDILASHGRPVVVGVSRKSFLGRITGRPVEERLPAGLAALSWCALRGAHVVRVHDVRESRDVLRMLAAFTGEEECQS